MAGQHQICSPVRVFRKIIRIVGDQNRILFCGRLSQQTFQILRIHGLDPEALVIQLVDLRSVNADPGFFQNGMFIHQPPDSDLLQGLLVPLRHISVVLRVQFQTVFMIAVAVVDRIFPGKLRKQVHRRLQTCLRLCRQNISGDQDHVRPYLINGLQQALIFFSVSLIVQIRQNHCLNRLFDSLIPQEIMPYHKTIAVVQHYPYKNHQDHCDHGNHHIQILCPHGLFPVNCQYVL